MRTITLGICCFALVVTLATAGCGGSRVTSPAQTMTQGQERMTASSFEQLVGVWQYLDTGCRPCVLNIKSAASDGQLVQDCIWHDGPIQCRGRASWDGKRISAYFTFAGGSNLDLALSKDGQVLQGTHRGYNENFSAAVSYNRIKAPK